MHACVCVCVCAAPCPCASRVTQWRWRTARSCCPRCPWGDTTSGWTWWPPRRASRCAPTWRGNGWLSASWRGRRAWRLEEPGHHAVHRPGAATAGCQLAGGVGGPGAGRSLGLTAAVHCCCTADETRVTQYCIVGVTGARGRGAFDLSYGLHFKKLQPSLSAASVLCSSSRALAHTARGGPPPPACKLYTAAPLSRKTNLTGQENVDLASKQAERGPHEEGGQACATPGLSSQARDGSPARILHFSPANSLLWT